MSLLGLPSYIRGIPLLLKLRNRHEGITPVHTGNTITTYLKTSLYQDHPRTYGEYKNLFDSAKQSQGSPPYIRGIRHPGLSGACLVGITPVHTGNTDYFIFMERLNQDHPRTYGEYTIASFCSSVRLGSPPYIRGIQFWGLGLFVYLRITPVHTGNTDYFIFMERLNQDHPRTYGEYLSIWSGDEEIKGSPPYIRGIPAR